MKIAVINLESSVHNKDMINKSLAGYTNELKSSFEIEEIETDSYNKDIKKEYDLVIFFVKTGGTENQFKDIFHKFSGSVYLLSTPFFNSLPASMEILSWVKARNGNGRIIHGNIEEVIQEIKRIGLIHITRKKLSVSKIGVIGKPSDWLIRSSEINFADVKRNWGIDIKEVELAEIKDLYNNVNEEKVEAIGNKIIKNATKIHNITKQDVLKASRIYFVLKKIIKKYQLSGITLRCFDLVNELGTTGCLALSLLNNEGIIAACEGDIPATFTMLLTYYLTKQLSFMVNPYEISRAKNQVKFAHCTIPTELTDHYELDTQFETNEGLGIHGILPLDEVTVIIIGGDKLDRYMLNKGIINKNTTDAFACRTQILVDFNYINMNYFFTNPVGNHHIIVPGNHKKIFRDFFSTISIDMFEHC